MNLICMYGRCQQGGHRTDEVEHDNRITHAPPVCVDVLHGMSEQHQRCLAWRAMIIMASHVDVKLQRLHIQRPFNLTTPGAWVSC